MNVKGDIVLRFSEIEVEVASSDHSEIAFLFGPHVTRDTGSASMASMRVEFTVPTRRQPDGGTPAEKEFLVRHDDGTPLLRRTFRGWGTMPPPLPPFAALGERYALMRAVVLAKNSSTVALVGGPYSETLSVASALAQRSWRFVSGQLLVFDLAEEQVVPCLLPLEARGRAARRMRTAGLSEESLRTVPSPLGGEMLLVRPESLGDVVPVDARIALPSLVRLCGAVDDAVRMAPTEFTPHVWPREADTAFSAAPRYQLEISSANGAEEAAGLIDTELTRKNDAERSRKKDDGCPDAPATGPAAPAGSTASLPT
ncbi:hypothetical protein ABZ845_21160 [Streptomyces sp. NPDC047022]|uniref:hypothetical protein n=1 Tax=Streptomyces sp. NPDC047022 TaxID=3155737 RepID=UPI0033DC2608